MSPLFPPPRSPKKTPSAIEWYPFYAGYADGFVKDVLSHVPRDSGFLIDPWNGAGTTTRVAASEGRSCIGIDANPVSVVLARGALVERAAEAGLRDMTNAVVAATKGGSVSVSLSDDPLNRWFTRPSAARIRGLERTVSRIGIGGNSFLLDAATLASLSAEVALLYLGLFRTVRRLTRRFESTNPTWIRQEVPAPERLSISTDSLVARFDRHMGEIADAVGKVGLAEAHAGLATIKLGSSKELPLDSGSVSTIVTSPPYSTRIDYVVATLPELSILGLSRDDTTLLRNSMIGTPTISRNGHGPEFGPTASQLLDRVSHHPSKASSGYYETFYRQYLAGMHVSLEEISRVSRDDATMILVVQDSYYKEVRIDIPAVLLEFSEGLGWDLEARYDYEARSRAAQNGHARSYKKRFSATESVLVTKRKRRGGN
jgi:hypothetical protein